MNTALIKDTILVLQRLGYKIDRTSDLLFLFNKHSKISRAAHPNLEKLDRNKEWHKLELELKKLGYVRTNNEFSIEEIPIFIHDSEEHTNVSAWRRIGDTRFVVRLSCNRELYNVWEVEAKEWKDKWIN